MKRRLVGAGIAAAAMLAVPGAALAQGVPPGPPATIYGSITGAQAGQGVIAIVINGSSSTVCGAGSVVSDSGSTVFVVDVISDSQRAGCGANGRTIRFYVTPTSPTTGGRLANESATWTGAGPKQQALTLGAALSIVKPIPFVASDGTG